ncbi:1-acyl-sn-glycerol-3-phosphate acyltransferase [Desulfoluna sp.]|uniref:1-acyl-sn-glycerol-3-phosphate acyltransferase n=1 Tax=Desulfoluna sp. TaxID=2045199 RepID=UPI00261BB12C|nr:1-acyl-sn-glycerol-3-phosphate acyltransferase [Desulfoluna sp.]
MDELLSLIGRLCYFLMGWRFEPLPEYVSEKHVIIGFPHTSNMDTVLAFFGFKIAKITGHIMIKKEWFFWPMSFILRLAGGVSVNRSSPQGVVEQMVNIFTERDQFILAIVPEGTRQKVTTIKTGFWHIAKSADVSIVCWYIDRQSKTTRWLGEVWPGESKAEDLVKIQTLYAAAGYAFPCVVSGDEVDPPL